METNHITIEYLNQKVQILQYLSESKNMFNKRLEYIKKLEAQNINWKEACRLSKIWHSIKYKQCRYIPEVYHKVIQYDK